jgi:hypothetical protein
MKKPAGQLLMPVLEVDNDIFLAKNTRRYCMEENLLEENSV